MNIEKNNKLNNKVNERQLLNELATDIANKFGIKKEKAKLLIKKETLIGIDSLKTELEKDNNKDEKKLDKKDIEKLFFSLRQALKIIENSSKTEIKILKEDIEKTINIEEFENHIENYLPPKLVNRAKNPEKPHEHILGLTLGATNSLITTANILLQIGFGLLKTPYHIFLIVTGKAQTNSFKNI